MNIEVHYGGHFGIVGNSSVYVGGKVSIISDFDSDKMSWFELRYMLKELGLVRDYLVFHLPPDKPIQTVLVEVNCDRSVLEMLNYLSLENNVVLYIMISKNVREELLPDYCLEEPGNNVLNQKNSAKGKEVEIEKSGPVQTEEDDGDAVVSANEVGFEGVFIAYAACLRGFVNGCRPIIGMDGCHLSSAAGGILLSAVARDGNNQMYPIAIAVVEVENKNTWSWFINILVDAVGVDNLLGVTFITDRQKGLVESLKLLVPCAEVRFCVRHLYANFKEKFKGLILKRLLWKAAASYSKIEHEAAMKEMQEINMDAYNYLQAIDKHLWSRSNFISRNRCDLICNNISEAFNKYIIDARDKPIITMLEMIRRQMMTRLQTKREQIVNFTGLICPKIKQKLDEISVKSRECTADYAGEDNFEVREKGRHCCLNMVDRVCDCNEWVLTGIPCRHAMAAIRYLRADPLDYTDECYSIAKYVAAYEGIIYPIPDSSHWKEQDGLTQILPPRLRRQPGRPAKNRKKTADEIREKQVVSRVGQMLRCSLCKKTGHNKRRCTEGTVTSGSIKKIKGRHSGTRQEVVQQSGTSQASTTARREKRAASRRRRTKAELIALWKNNQQD